MYTLKTVNFNCKKIILIDPWTGKILREGVIIRFLCAVEIGKQISIFFSFFQRSVTLPKDFPSEEVYEAYLHPVVDESTEMFEWGKPDLHSLRLYLLK